MSSLPGRSPSRHISPRYAESPSLAGSSTRVSPCIRQYAGSRVRFCGRLAFLHVLRVAGTGEDINVELVDLSKTRPRCGHVRLYALIALRDIEPGEELLLAYGPEYKREW